MLDVRDGRNCKATVKERRKRLCDAFQLHRHFQTVRHTISAMHGSAAGFYAIANNGESQAGSARLSLACKLGPVEGPEDIFEFTFRKPRAVVSHRNDHFTPFLPRQYFDRTGGPRVAHRVPDDIGKRPVQAVGLSQHHQIRLDHGSDLNTLVTFTSPYLTDNIRNQNSTEFRSLLSYARSREGQQLVHES